MKVFRPHTVCLQYIAEGLSAVISYYPEPLSSNYEIIISIDLYTTEDR